MSNFQEPREGMSVLEARRTVRDYVCAVCWGQLVNFFDATHAWIKCANPNCQGGGYVTRAYADRRRSESLGEAAEVRHNLRFIFPTPARKAADILKEL